MNGNANGISSLKRMELEYSGISYQFTINPQSYDIKIPSRLNLVYTKGGAFIDLFGQGVKEINISGTTGLKANTNDPNHGYQKFLELKKLIEADMDKVQEGQPINEFLKFYNHTDGEAYVVVPITMSIKRNVSEPLLYKYDLSFYAIRNVSDPAPSNADQGIGFDGEIPSTLGETVIDRTTMEAGTGYVETNNNFQYTYSGSNQNRTFSGSYDDRVKRDIQRNKVNVDYIIIDKRGTKVMPQWLQ